MLRRLIYIVALAVASGAVGYAVALQARPAAPLAAPTETAQGPIDWSRLPAEELMVAQVFVTAKNTGVEAALDTLQLLVARNASLTRRAHQLAHSLGRFAIAQNGNDPGVLARCRPLFQAGCYHGVLEGYLLSVGEVDARRLSGMCEALAAPGEAVISARECAHGLGHGLLERFGYEFGAALGACDAFGAEAFREECHDGVFMQNLVNGQGLPAGTTDVAEEADASGHDHGAGAPARHAAGFKRDDLSFPCNAVKDAYQPSCWSYQPVAIRRFLGDPGPQTLFACDLAPAGARTRCYAGYGKQTLSRYNDDEATLIELCSLALPPHDEACLGGVVEVLIDREWGPSKAMGFCQRVAMYGRSPESCYQTVGARVALLHASDAETERACALAGEPAHVSACVRGGAEARRASRS